MGSNLGNNYGKFYSFLSKPVALDLNFVVDSSNGNGLGVRNVKGQGVKNVYMQTSATPAAGNPMVDTTSAGFCLIELEYNYARAYAGPLNIISPTSGSALAINGSALTPGLPYIIASTGNAAKGAVTIAPTGADSSGSLASTAFNLYDGYGNNFLLWFYVTGIGGGPPAGVAGIPVQVTIAEGASVDAQTTALSGVIALLPSGISGVDSFTCSGGGTTTLTVTSTAFGPVAGPPAAVAAVPYLATFAQTIYNTNLENWQAVGLPKGVLPNPGASFIATAAGQSSHGGSSGTVLAVGISGIDGAEIIGDPNQSIAPIPMGGSANVGSWLLLQFQLDGVVTAPANNTVISMTLLLEAGARVGGNSE